jgi:hypothetical protein
VAVTVNLDAVLNPDYQNSSIADLAGAPVSALSGIDEDQAAGLSQAFGINTISDLADNPFVRAAIAIREMAKVGQ